MSNFFRPTPSSDQLTRRRMLKLAGAGALGWSLLDSTISGRATAAQKADQLESLNRFPRMVQEYFVSRVRAAERAMLEAQHALRTKADAEAYVKQVQARARESFGPFPERTPLNARITGVVERDEYKIEKLIFESRPGFLVTANLYLPKGRPFPAPAVVGTCGHSNNGKAAGAYQSFSQGLAKQGYVCLIYDPISQGERLQYPDENLTSKIRPGVGEHLYGGNPQFLVGEFLGMWRAWDGIRALDYLLTREEVDPNHIGVTGNSGGGTMTTWLCGIESRWTMAAPSCFVTTFRRNMENELPADTEQCPPRALSLHLDHSDFIAAMAPKPVILLAKERDFFDARGAEEAYARLKRIYQLLGAEENISLFVGPTYHGYSQENREAMYGWFNRATGVAEGLTEPEITIEDDETLSCTPQGQVAPLGSKPIYEFTREKSKQLAENRQTLSGNALAQAVTETLKLPSVAGPPDYRILRPVSSRKYPTTYSINYVVQTEPVTSTSAGAQAIVTRLSDERIYSRPFRGKQRAVLYVSHHSADAELRDEPLIPELLKSETNAVFFACDVRGIGDSKPDTCGTNSFFSPYGSDYFYAIHSIMLDRPYVGQKTHDVLRVLDWLNSVGHSNVHLVAKGWGSIPATFAAMLSPYVKQVTLKNALTSYADIAESETYNWPLSSFLPNVLEKFDLPDCYRELESKQLRQIDPWGSNPEIT
ncbi:MAG: prolyl oligopeptidase family serine peptidase [Planctomycetaceae bacterium]|nr:prolyl oligopeptidase family serine peptidase [Planctomycetaceae bacterium]